MSVRLVITATTSDCLDDYLPTDYGVGDVTHIVERNPSVPNAWAQATYGNLLLGEERIAHYNADTCRWVIDSSDSPWLRGKTFTDLILTWAAP